MKKQIAVIGSSECNNSIFNDAVEVGKLIADKGYVLVTGGRGGVMEGACKGCKMNGGKTICILPGKNKIDANKYCDYTILSGIGEMRNFLVVQSADTVVAISGGYGTLSELSIAEKQNKIVYLYKPSKVTEMLKDKITVINNLGELRELL